MMVTGTRRHTEQGFTLLEVLVATAIMGLAVAGVMSGLAAASANTARLTQYDHATLLAQQKMDELLAERTLPRQRPLEGRFSPQQSGGLESGWIARVTPFETRPGGNAPGRWVVDRVELEVWWIDGAVRRAFALDGYRRAILRVEDFE